MLMAFVLRSSVTQTGRGPRFATAGTATGFLKLLLSPQHASTIHRTSWYQFPGVSQ